MANADYPKYVFLRFGIPHDPVREQVLDLAETFTKKPICVVQAGRLFVDVTLSDALEHTQFSLLAWDEYQILRP